MRNYRLQFCGIQELLSDQELSHFAVDKLESFLQLITIVKFVKRKHSEALLRDKKGISSKSFYY